MLCRVKEKEVSFSFTPFVVAAVRDFRAAFLERYVLVDIRPVNSDAITDQAVVRSLLRSRVR